MSESRSRLFRDRLYTEIIEALDAMPTELREVFVLSHYSGRKPSDIARQIDLSESETQQMLSRANRSFYNQLSRVFMGPRCCYKVS